MIRVFYVILALCSSWNLGAQILSPILFGSGGVPSTISYVNSSNCIGISSGCTTGSVDMIGANLLVIAEPMSTFGGAPSGTRSDSSSNSYYGPLIVYNNATCTTRGGTNAIGIWYSPNPVVTSSMTATVSGSGIYPSAVFAGYSGVLASSPLDPNINCGVNAAGLTVAPTAITPATNDELVVTGLVSTGTITPTINSSFNVRQAEHNSTAAYNYGLADFIQTTATSEGPTWTYASGSNKVGSTSIGAFMNGTVVTSAYDVFMNFETSTNGTALTAAILNSSAINVGQQWSSGSFAVTGSTGTEVISTSCQSEQLTSKNIGGTTYADSAGTRGVLFTSASGNANEAFTVTPPAVSGAGSPNTGSLGFWMQPNITSSSPVYYYSMGGVIGNGSTEDFVHVMWSNNRTACPGSPCVYLETKLNPNGANDDSGSHYIFTSTDWYYVSLQYVGYLVLDTSSTSSVAIPGSTGGTITLTTALSDGLTAGTVVSAFNSSNTADGVTGTVSSDSGTTLVINVNNIYGSGTPSAWNISTSAMSLALYNSTGTLLSTQIKASDPAAAGGINYFNMGFGGDNSNATDNFCMDGATMQWIGASEYPIQP